MAKILDYGMTNNKKSAAEKDFKISQRDRHVVFPTCDDQEINLASPESWHLLNSIRAKENSCLPFFEYLCTHKKRFSTGNL